MSDKLKELTDRLYAEGLSKGKQEGEEILANAKAQAESIIAKAKAEASQITAKAEKDAEDLKAKVATDIKMASTQTIAAIRQQAEAAIATKAITAPVKDAFADKDFVKGLIATIAKAFNPSDAESKPLELILPASLLKEMGDKYAGQLAKELNNSVEVKPGKGIAGGFKIGPKGEGYQISFTDEDFASILGQYLRPATKKILFGE